MASEIAIDELAGIGSPMTVLDPMAGSGTVLRAAAELGHNAIGFDLDPLSVLMAQVWTTPIQIARLADSAEKLVAKAKTARDIYLPWIDDCEETRQYVKFWFCPKQERSLRRLAFVLGHKRGVIADALRIALSRIIITKERGASVARDTSHSRPHRVFVENDFDVYEGFLQSVRQLANRLNPQKVLGAAQIKNGDSRCLAELPRRSIDVVITSPPYLNAIDYLRGHRLSLVWLGYGIPGLRDLRSNSIGAERGAELDVPEPLLTTLVEPCGTVERLTSRQQGMVRRYAQDVYWFMRELARVVKKDGRVVLVVGNSRLNGVNVSNAEVNVAAARLVGFRLVKRSERALPSSSRYLPMPSSRQAGTLANRMRTETLLTFCLA